MSTPIALTVLGGFLGAGKTTVLNYLLQAPHGLRLMVLVNDFGAVNIDAALIESVSNEGVISLRNGCVCCSMGGELMNALMKIEQQSDSLDALIIEGSGVSDPKKIAQIGKLGEGFSLSSIVTVVDAASILSQRNDPHVGDMVKTQIASAHLVLLNKTDLVDAAVHEQVVAWLHEIAPGVPVVTGSKGRYDWEWLLSPSTGQKRQASSSLFGVTGMGMLAGKASAKEPQLFQSYCFECESIFDGQRLLDVFANMDESVWRAKGLVRTGAEGMVHVLHYVRGQPVILEPFMRTVAASSLVFIGTGVFDKQQLNKVLKQALLD